MEGTKLLIVLSLALALTTTTALALDLRGVTIELRNVSKPVEKNEGRITSGITASPKQFPYQVGLDLYVYATDPSWCGGSIIGHRWVLTAAHCTVGVQRAEVHLGATYRTKPIVTYTVFKNNIIIHSGFNSITFENDISLIRIPYVSFNRRIQAVKLPSMASSHSTYAGDYAIASGWGRISDVELATVNDLQWARFQIISNGACQETFKFLAPCSMCVDASNGVSTCNGDSGGPLVLESNRRLVGVTSFGNREGCEKHYPAAFVRVTNFLEWIYRKTGISY